MKPSRKSTSKKTTAEPSTARQALAAKLLARLPKSRLSWKFGNASLEIDGKVFAFTRSNEGVAMKMPEDRVRQLTESGTAALLQMGKRTMREWIVVPEAASDATIGLMAEAQDFVAALARRDQAAPRSSSAAKKAPAKKAARKA